MNIDHRSPTNRQQSASHFQRSQIFYFASYDGGISWPDMTEIAIESGQDLSKNTGSRPIEEIELLRTLKSLYIFFTGLKTNVTRLSQGPSWCQVVAINPYSTSLSMGEIRSTSVSAASCTSGGRVVWIDHRYRRSDRHRWNPLGGLPWSDDTPFWVNNDLLSLKLSDVDAIVSGNDPVEPERLTVPLSFLRSVRARSKDDKIAILWSGRKQVGKGLESANAPPQLFLVLISGG